MAEFIELTAVGESYEDAIGKACEMLLKMCGTPLAKVYRRDPDDDAERYRDWVLDSSNASTSGGGTMVGVEASFFLYGSDE